MADTDNEMNAVVRFAEFLADRAGTVSLSGFRQNHEVKCKDDKSPVTAIDQGVETLVRNLVSETFPSHGFLGEEFGSINLDSPDVWVVDPIDGTRSFITGWPIWGTLVAKLSNNHPELGVIDMPAIGERWVGVRGKSCIFRDAAGSTQICRASDCKLLENARFYTTNILYFEPADKLRIETLLESTAVPRFGGDCYPYGLLASGFVDLVVEAKLEPYDYFALVPVVEGAGGIITDWSGASLTEASDGRVIAAATAELHQAALSVLTTPDKV
ncbi:inositol monophosphatase family protein [Salaquimonas pukyongi]|uniref:inositol monophosphatase family protein n=1 Tax=Salaquimonas pukyongi TaxID=2712698 RepID=UPI00096B6890|nr:inositol monophosphatase family protein [Salaquimonas pukyongi]